MMDDGNKINAVFIGGQSRSGSTLLDLLLGQVDGFFSVGELRYIWERGFLENNLCGCGKQFRHCHFWGQVVEETFGSFQRMDIKGLHALWNTVERTWYYSLFPYLARIPGYQKKFTAYVQVLSQLYTAIQKVSGAQFIVDSSKKPFHGFLLHATPGIHLHVIHLIRDCRAVGYSWQRRKVRPEIHWKKEYMPIMSPAYSAMDWNLRNGLMDMLKYIARRYTVVQYEALARDPQTTLNNILSYLQAKTLLPEILERSEFDLTVHHTVGGNPMRFQRGRIAVHPDLEWRHNMPTRHRLLTTMLSWPLLVRYGYLRKGPVTRNTIYALCASGLWS
jgi:hypothetical protein